MTEDATNAEEWGPTTTTMASISEAARTFHEYERIVQVLRGRLAIDLPSYVEYVEFDDPSPTPKKA